MSDIICPETGSLGPQEVVYREIDSLNPSKNNPRTHSRHQKRRIADNIEVNGFLNPALIDENLTIIAGHGRIAAAKLLGWKKVPTLMLSGLTEAQKRAYVIADNRLAELAGWDMELLGAELEYLDDLDLSFDLSVTGWDAAEIDILISGASDKDSEPEPEPSTPPVGKKAISRLGELWSLGRHKLYVGDATNMASYRKLMGRSKARIVFTDPPYNVPIEGHARGHGARQHREFEMAVGEMSQEEFTIFLEIVFYCLVGFSVEGSIHYICMDWRHMQELMDAAHGIYSKLKNLCVWNKTNGGMGAFYRSKHELIFLYKNGSGPHINNFQLGQNGRYRTNVWDYAGANSFHSGRDEQLDIHPTVKPIQMVADALMDCSNRGDIVLDPFGGSGTTLLAAERVGREARIMEIDPLYADVIIKRWENLTGETAIHSETGETYQSRMEAHHA